MPHARMKKRTSSARPLHRRLLHKGGKTKRAPEDEDRDDIDTRDDERVPLRLVRGERVLRVAREDREGVVGVSVDRGHGDRGSSEGVSERFEGGITRRWRTAVEEKFKAGVG